MFIFYLSHIIIYTLTYGNICDSYFIDECVDASDCNNQGSCIDIKATKFPRRQCFCNPGWFGEGCIKRKYRLLQITYL